MEDDQFEGLMIPTYIINLEKRTDRLTSVLTEFGGKPEFDVNVIKACENKLGTVGLWNSIRKVIKMAIDHDDDIIIIVEDDHVFTKDYTRDYLFKNIIEAHRQGADILSGGIGGGFQHLIPITENRFWINHFWSTQFLVIYKAFFEEMLKADFRSTDTADDFISNLTNNKMVLFPFISTQKSFGYSDVTEYNNTNDISKLFDRAQQEISVYQKIFNTYQSKML